MYYCYVHRNKNPNDYNNIDDIIFTDKTKKILKNIETNKKIPNRIMKLIELPTCRNSNCQFYKFFLKNVIVVKIIKEYIFALSTENRFYNILRNYSLCGIKILTTDEINIVANKLINSYPIGNKKLYKNNDFYKLQFYCQTILYNKSIKLNQHIKNLLLNFKFYGIRYLSHSGIINEYLKNESIETCQAIIKNKNVIFTHKCQILKNNLYNSIYTIKSWIDNLEFIFESHISILSKILDNNRTIIKKSHIIESMKKYNKRSGINNSFEQCIDLMLSKCNYIDSNTIINLINYGHKVKNIHFRNILSNNNYQDILFDIHKNTYKKNNKKLLEIITNNCKNKKYWNYHLILQKFNKLQKIDINISEKDFKNAFPIKFLINALYNTKENDYDYYLGVIKDFNYNVCPDHFRNIIEHLPNKGISTKLLYISDNCKK